MTQSFDKTFNFDTNVVGLTKYLPSTVENFKRMGDNITVFQNAIIRETVKIGEHVVIREFCNIYGNAEIGDYTKIGAYTEIGHALIGKYVTIGAKCFIPSCVAICDNAWIAPCVTFTNDRFPPSDKDKWQATLVECSARIGAGVTVVCGVIIGHGSLVGSGSTVTKNIPPNEVWAGNPARKIR